MRKLIHQYWEGEEMPGVLRRLCATWSDLNPGYVHRLWDAASVAGEFSGDPLFSELLALCDGIAERSDVIRYFLLARFGGWWADTDFECLVPLDRWEIPGPVEGFVGASEAPEKCRTSIGLLYAEPGCGVLGRAIGGLRESLGRMRGTSDRTGIRFLERHLPDAIALLPTERVYPTSYDDWREKLALGRDIVFAGGAWACHYWWGTWLGGAASRDPGMIEAFLDGKAGSRHGPEIFIHGMGGIGNQLFQLAYGLHLAERFGCRVTGTLRLLDGLEGIPAELTRAAPPRECERLGNCDDSRAGLLLGRPGGGTLALVGFFQEYGHFEGLRGRLASLFGAVAKRNSIGIHVRRGDYLSSGHYMGLTPAYYRSGVLRLINEIGVACEDIVVFSDDPAWCCAEIVPMLEGIAPTRVFQGDTIQTLRFMKSMSGMVIPNSTFSWWGAWLAGCPVLHPGAWPVPGGSMSPALGCDHPGWRAHGLHWQETGDAPPAGENDLPTIISAYFDLGPFQKGNQGVRDPAWYRMWLARLGLIINPLVFFAECEDDLETVRRARAVCGLPTMVALVDRAGMSAFERVELVRQSIDRADFRLSPPNTTVAEYSCVQHAKYELVAEAIRLGWVRTTHCCWMDCGKLIECLSLDSRCLYRINPPKGDSRLVHYSEAAPFKARSLRDIQTGRGGEGEFWLAGGFFCGETPRVESWCVEYLAAAFEFQEQGWVFTDQVVLTAMASLGKASRIAGFRCEDPWFGLCRSLLERVSGPSVSDIRESAMGGPPPAQADVGIRLALMFLTRDDLNHPDIWEEFAGADADVFAHVKNPSGVKSPFLSNAVKVGTIPTEWGGISLVRATLRLLEVALRDSGASHFALLSESCVPIKPLAEITARLAMDPRSRMAWEGIGDMAIVHRHRVSKAIGVPADRWMMQHQWMVLSREVAELVVSEDLTDRFGKVFAPDEHYFATVLAMMGYPLDQGIRRMRSTWVEWETVSPRPWLSVGPGLALDLRESPSFFARKFLRGSDIGRWKLHLDTRPVAMLEQTPGGAFRVSRSGSRILVAVCSGRENRGARQACRETWCGTGRPPGIGVRFFIGGGTHTSEEDVTGLMVSDSSAELPGKVCAMLAHVLEHEGFDWILRCEDTAYVDLGRLSDLCPDGADLMTDRDIMNGGAGSNNICYLISRSLALRLVREGAIPATGSDRAQIVSAALRLGAKITATDALRASGQAYPRADNAIICARAGDPVRMKAVHTVRSTEPEAELRVEQANWKDSLLVHADGTFARKNEYWAGSLVRDPVGMALKWFDWDPERLVEAPEGSWADYRVEHLDWTDGGDSDGVDILAGMAAGMVPVELVRYGPEADGGYAVPAAIRFDRVITVGVKNGIGFEAGYARSNPGTRFDLFDPTVGGLPESLDGAVFHPVGVGSGDGSLALPEVLEECARDGETVLLKMDCEGAEWDCGLDRIDPAQIHAIVIEIHGMLGIRGRMRGRRVLAALARDFVLVHMHGNNHSAGGCVRGHRLTDWVELTLVNRRIVESLRNDRAAPPPAFENDPAKPPAVLALLPPETVFEVSSGTSPAWI